MDESRSQTTMGFEVGIAVSDSTGSDVVQLLVSEMNKTGLNVETFHGLSNLQFIKVCFGVV